MNPEQLRLSEDSRREKNWKRWGPYLSERQWGTVREDYSPDGECWDYFPHDHARSRAYRWGEDGLLGICDREGRLCFGIALWNGQDGILKERLFGLSTKEGNHGEDVKECYFYLDSTPTHSYMKALYKYPQRAFPYQELVDENKRRSRMDPEFELLDTGIFGERRYFDIQVEYAKVSPDDILIRIKATNRGSDTWPLHVLPTLWFRNTWAWGRTGEGYSGRPVIEGADGGIRCEHQSLGEYSLDALTAPDRWLFTENETDFERLGGGRNASPWVKDAFHRFVTGNDAAAVNSAARGTKAAAHYRTELAPGASTEIHLRLRTAGEAPIVDFEAVFAQRIAEADEFHGFPGCAGTVTPAMRVAREAEANLMWSKQFYNFGVLEWLQGDPVYPRPPASRWHGRNSAWLHLYNRDIISMPDNWEFPWYASWDLAFHMVAFAEVDPAFAKDQLILLLREWYMHPSGQIPAYEFEFGDVNPPVHAWAAWRVYKISAPPGERDRSFLERVFQKLLINFTWWANRKDVAGSQVFSGGFLGLDNIGVFDRSKPVDGGILEQADGSAWMAFYCLTMLAMAMELAQEDPVYEDVASKFFEHFIAISDAINTLGGTGLWNEDDGFYYDQLRVGDETTPMKVRSMVGLIPLFAVEVLEQDEIDKLPGFKSRMEWFLANRQDLYQHISMMQTETPRSGAGAASSHLHRLLAIPTKSRLRRVLQRLLNEREFLSPYGIRSLSAEHRDQPYVLRVDGEERRIRYEPGESETGLFGGNSNWRGPVWFPVNYLLMESLERYHHFYGDDFKIECPVGSGVFLSLREVAGEINRRLCSLFETNESGYAAWQGDTKIFSTDPNWRGLTWFHEYFHGDTGRGCGASHQTGWTALIARCLRDGESADAIESDSSTSKGSTLPRE